MNTILIGERIKQARTIRNLTLDHIATDIGVAKSTIQRYEKGLITNPKLPVLQAIANALNVDPSWLAGKSDTMELSTYDKRWDKEADRFESKLNAFYFQLRSLGWAYEWSEKEEVYILSNGTSSIKITSEEYSRLTEESQAFCRRQLQKLLFRSNFYIDAAHARTDVDLPEDADTTDSDLMDDDDNWE